MLWYKGWLETRVRFAITVGTVAAFLSFIYSHPARSGPAMGGVPRVSILWICALLGGSGIITQSAFQATKGIYGSTFFTLTLPVSRLRLLTTRAFIGWLESVVAIVIFCCGVWLENKGFNATSVTVMAEFTGTLVAAASALYFVSVLLGTFLEDQWRNLGTLAVPILLWQISSRVKLPRFADILNAVGNGSPLVTYTMPWPAISFSLVLAAILFLIAYQVVQTREY